MKFCSAEFIQPPFFLLQVLKLSVPYLVTEIMKTVNKLLYGRILFEQAQYDVKAQPVSPLWLYKTYLFLKAQHLAVNCTGYLQGGSRIGWFTLSPEAIHCAGHHNVRRAFFFPQKLRNLIDVKAPDSWLQSKELRWGKPLQPSISSPALPELTTKHQQTGEETKCLCLSHTKSKAHALEHA